MATYIVNIFCDVLGRFVIMSVFYRHRRPKKNKSTITVRACLNNNNHIGVEVVLKPNKLAKRVKLPYNVKRQSRRGIVYDAGRFENIGTVQQVAFNHEDTDHRGVDLATLNLIRLRAARIPSFDQTRLRPDIWSKLYPFQKEGIRQAISKNYGKMMFCDEMGLGKSLQSLVVADYYRAQWPLLVVCPSYLRFNWKNEIEKWGLATKIQVVMKGDETIDRVTNEVIVVSYDLAVRQVANLQGFRVIIADESHYIKNRKAKRTKVCVPLFKQAKRVLLLTGTPALSRPAELFTQLSAVAPTTFKYFGAFAKRYCDAKMGPFGWDVTGMSNEEELQVVLKFCMLRRLKKDVLTDLPPKRREEIMVPLKDSELKQIQPGFDELRNISIRIFSSPPGTKETRDLMFQRKQLVSALFRQTATIKTNIVREYLKSVLPELQDKVIVFAHHKIMLDAIEEACKAAKKTYIRMDGSTPQKNRAGMVEQFKTKGDVAILSIAACGTGLNFTMCSHIIFAELRWNPGELLQAEDRCHRIGQAADSILIQYLLADGSLDNYVWKKVNAKFGVLDTVLNDHNQDGFQAESTELEVDRDDEFLEALAIHDPKMAQHYRQTLAQLGIHQHTMAFGTAWFPPAKTVGVTMGYTSVANLSALIDKHGTEVPRDVVLSQLFLGDAVSSPFAHDEVDGFLNLHEWNGTLSSTHGPYYVLTDTPTPLSVDACVAYAGPKVVMCRCEGPPRKKKRTM